MRRRRGALATFSWTNLEAAAFAVEGLAPCSSTCQSAGNSRAATVMSTGTCGSEAGAGSGYTRSACLVRLSGQPQARCPTRGLR